MWLSLSSRPQSKLIYLSKKHSLVDLWLVCSRPTWKESMVCQAQQLHFHQRASLNLPIMWCPPMVWNVNGSSVGENHVVSYLVAGSCWRRWVVCSLQKPLYHNTCIALHPLFSPLLWLKSVSWCSLNVPHAQIVMGSAGSLRPGCSYICSQSSCGRSSACAHLHI